MSSKTLTPSIKTTIRHEVQHFTQSFYSRVFGITSWIGLPSKKIVKGKNLFTSNSGSPYDIPVEISTYVQDEIGEFIEDLSALKDILQGDDIRPYLRDKIFVFVGIGRTKENPKPWNESHIFRHYFETNKDIWRWATSKLLFAIKSM